MTNDNFNDAARAEAERVARENTPLEYDSIREAFVDAYAAGLQARTHLAAQEPTDAEVETAARAMRIETLGDTVRPGVAARWWDSGDVSPDEVDKLRRLARTALSAARATRRDEEAR